MFPMNDVGCAARLQFMHDMCTCGRLCVEGWPTRFVCPNVLMNVSRLNAIFVFFAVLAEADTCQHIPLRAGVLFKPHHSPP